MANRRITDRFHAVKLTVKAKRPISGRPIKSNKNKTELFQLVADDSTVEIMMKIT